MKRVKAIALAIAPFVAVLAGIIAAKLAPVLMRHAAQISDSSAPQPR